MSPDNSEDLNATVKPLTGPGDRKTSLVPEIKKLLKFMKEENLLELDLEDQELKVKIRRRGLRKKKTEELAPRPGSRPAEIPPESPAHNLREVVSPISGIFYSALAPGARPFVEVGEEVRPGQLLCIIEAMKMMNEIKSELDGKINRILVKNGDLVSADQPLFLLE